MPLSQKQMEYLALAWQCFETEPKIDYNKFYQIAQLASANSARELMRVTKKKLKEEYGALAATSGDPPGTPRSATNTNTPKKASKATGRNGGASGSSATGTPSAAGKKRGRKPKGFEGRGGEDLVDEKEEEGSPLKKGKMGGLVEVKREKSFAEEDDEESIFQ
ncbi:hypothetical protein KC331_g6325 [Hortaea werneckii]|nr:hypothetical protein KC331_g6325 [Hortaea werneckii]KAI7707069.1 hypothetical protein KC353_g11865 [Hortaea werneckii]